MTSGPDRVSGLGAVLGRTAGHVPRQQALGDDRPCHGVAFGGWDGAVPTAKQ